MEIARRRDCLTNCTRGEPLLTSTIEARPPCGMRFQAVARVAADTIEYRRATKGLGGSQRGVFSVSTGPDQSRIDALRKMLKPARSPFTLRRSLRVYHACLHATSVSGAGTSVRVSQETLRELEEVRRLLGTRTADETIRKLVAERRSRVLARAFGSAKGRLRQFTEEDRIESHY